MNTGLSMRGWPGLGWQWFGAAVASAALQGHALAGAPAQTEAPADARAWMVRVQQAALKLNYHGTLVSSAGGVVSSSRVSHYCQGKQRYERVEALDGEAREVLRQNDLTHTLWPRTRVAVLEQHHAVPEFPALLATDANALDAYDLRVLGAERVAGHEAQVLMLKPRDAHRFAQRLWAERASGLLLRADVLGARGEVLESASFSEVSIGGKPGAEVVQQAKRLDGYRVVRPLSVPTQLDAEGWRLAHPVPGFRLVGCMRKELGASGEPLPAGSPPVLMTVFSDGLTHVSVFIEPYDAGRHRPLATSLGATHTVMTRAGDWWITAMGDVPMGTVQLFAGALERRR